MKPFQKTGAWRVVIQEIFNVPEAHKFLSLTHQDALKRDVAIAVAAGKLAYKASNGDEETALLAMAVNAPLTTDRAQIRTTLGSLGVQPQNITGILRTHDGHEVCNRMQWDERVGRQLVRSFCDLPQKSRDALVAYMVALLQDLQQAETGANELKLTATQQTAQALLPVARAASTPLSFKLSTLLDPRYALG